MNDGAEDEVTIILKIIFSVEARELFGAWMMEVVIAKGVMEDPFNRLKKIQVLAAVVSFRRRCVNHNLHHFGTREGSVLWTVTHLLPCLFVSNLIHTVSILIVIKS